ncbi:family 43 member 3 [Seminavis robusta]|uniref:Family 43 member 3 n=1 Tax=Seminavis robusta TaxID=568900 RepID=A0A9N8E1M3_9STRA|nr:family 43 member 3 [Seminavis robusta]|eukprot:Sro561_g166740.1 family 43 member 3 (503) ;mRNA; f:1402-3023
MGKHIDNPLGENQPLLGSINESTDSSGKKEISPLSQNLRWVTNVISLLSVFLYSGIIFGWAPLELMLVREGQYSETCIQPTNGEDGICPQQVIRLQGMFTVGQFLLSFASLLVGWFVDHAPKTLYFAIAATVEIAGLVLFAYSDSQSFDYFVLAYGLMALGGNLTMLGAFPASFLLPSHQTGLLACNSCFFDASSIVFFIFHRLNLGWGLSRKFMFLVLACVCVVVYMALAMCWFILERKNWRQVIEEESAGTGNQTQQHIQDDHDLEELAFQQAKAENINKSNNIKSLWDQVKSKEFSLILIFTSLHMLRANYYIMTVDDLLRFNGDVGTYANIFSFVLPFGVIFVPAIDYTVRILGVLNTMHVTNLLGVTFGIFLCLPILPIQVATFAIFACFRAFLYATANNAVAMYFGVETMGRMIGFVFTTCAMVSLMQYPIALFAGQGHWYEMNWLMLGISVFPILKTVLYKETQDEKVLTERLSYVKSPVMTMPVRLSQRLEADL